MLRLCILLLLFYISFVFCSGVKPYSGVDVSDHVYIDGFQCLKGLGYDYAIVRCWHSYGAPDLNAPHTMANARVANISRVDVYMFPCQSCGDGARQVREAVAYLKAYNSSYSAFWFDIEGGSSYWSLNHETNQQFFEDMVQEAETLGLQIGVYTSASQWNPIMGSTYTGGSAYPVWYAHYDDNPSFSDFTPFGGWTTPDMKQYNGDVTVCGYDLDTDWAESMDF